MRLALPAFFHDLTIRQLSVLHTSDDHLEWICVCGEVTMADVREMPLKMIEKATTHLTALRDAETYKHPQIIEIGGQEFGFIPDWDAFSTGEWIDIENQIQDVYQNATSIMSILYRPITRRMGDKYEIAKYTAKEDDSIFNDVSAEIFTGALLFFWTTKNALLETTALSLREMGDEAIESLKSGDGMMSSINSPITTFSKWTRLLRSRFKSFSNIFRTSRTFTI